MLGRLTTKRTTNKGEFVENVLLNQSWVLALTNTPFLKKKHAVDCLAR